MPSGHLYDCIVKLNQEICDSNWNSSYCMYVLNQDLVASFKLQSTGNVEVENIS